MSETPLIVADCGIPGIEGALARYGRLRLLPSTEIHRTALLDADLLVVRSVVPVRKDLLSGTRIRFVGSATAGTDHVDLAYLNRAGITFTSAPGANADSVADHVMTSLLMLACREGGRLSGRTLGVVGCGEVGSRVVKRAKGLGLNVLRCDPPRSRREGHAGFHDIDHLIDACDDLTLHTPLTRTGRDQTHHLLDQGRLERVKGWLVNTARGSVVDGAALLKLRRQGKGPDRVVLDVWENEPTPDPDLVGVTDIATSHVAGYATDSKWQATERMRAAVARHLGLEPGPPSDPLPRCEVSGLKPAQSSVEWLAALAQTMCPLGRDDSALREAVRQGGRAFEAYRSNYPGRRLMRMHTLDAVLPGLETAVAEGLEVRLGLDA